MAGKATPTGERVLLVASSSWDGGLPDGSPFKGVYGKTIVWSDHPAAIRWPDLFIPVVPTHETPRRATAPVVEAATAAPGEKR
jgi:hypothetical protein